MKIGFTERGDAGIDFTWFEKIKNDTVDGAVLITKRITPVFRKRVMDLFDENKKLIVHCTCTGWGSSKLEPNVPMYKTQLDELKALIDMGFPKNQCVLRIDPIFPVSNGFRAAKNTLNYAKSIGLLPMRVRISIFDEYPHVRQRFINNGLKPIYDQFYAPYSMMNAAAANITVWAKEFGIIFETCAETKLVSIIDDEHICIAKGCLSETDINILGLSLHSFGENIQHRNGCHCLDCKTELLTKRQPCPNSCLYCFWKDK